MNTQQTGFSLLEVLLSLAIFSIGLLGLLKLQTASMQYAYASMLRAQGQIQVVNMANERMLPAAPDKTDWQASNTRYLPQSQSNIGRNEVRLVWQAYGEADAVSLQLAAP